MSPDCSRSNVSDGFRPSRTDPAHTISVTRRSPHFSKHRCRMASGRAHRLVARSRVFRTARTTFRAWTAGRLSTDQAARPSRPGSRSAGSVRRRRGPVGRHRRGSRRHRHPSRPRVLASVGGRAGHHLGRTRPTRFTRCVALREPRRDGPHRRMDHSFRIAGTPGRTRGTHATSTPGRHSDSPSASSRCPGRPGPSLPRSRRHADCGRGETTHQPGL